MGRELKMSLLKHSQKICETQPWEIQQDSSSKVIYSDNNWYLKRTEAESWKNIYILQLSCKYQKAGDGGNTLFPNAEWLRWYNGWGDQR